MGRAATLRREQVFEAANGLKTRGVKVSTTSIREALGDVGSYTSISKFLDDWRASDAAADRDVAANVPEAAEQAMLVAIREVWRILTATTRLEIATSTETADAKARETKAQVVEAHGEVERLEKENTAMADELASLKIKASELENLRIVATALESELRGRLTAEEKRSRELESRVGELGAAEAELRKNLAAEEGRTQALDRQVRELDGQLLDLKGREARTAEAYTKALADAAAATTKNEAAVQKIAELGAQLGAATTVEAALKERVKAEETRTQALDKRMDELSRELLRLASSK